MPIRGGCYSPFPCRGTLRRGKTTRVFLEQRTVGDRVPSIPMRSIINSGLGNGRTVFFARNEWRDQGSVRQQSHQRLDEKTMRKDHHAPRGQPQKMSREAHFLAERTADLVARLVPCKLLP